MNRLQDLGNAPPLFVTLNPAMEPSPESVHLEQVYEHPLFDAGAMRAQEALWSLQGRAPHLVLRRLFRLRLP